MSNASEKGEVEGTEEERREEKKVRKLDNVYMSAYFQTSGKNTMLG